MYTVGSLVIYGSEGVCRIGEIQENRFGDMQSSRLYYVLSPVSANGTKIYVPCDNKLLVSKMKKVMSKEEIKRFINEDVPEIEWIEDNRQRNKAYKDILQTYDRKQILSLCKLLYTIKSGQGTTKRLYASDEEIYKKAIKILHSEFSSALNIELEEVMPFVLGELDCVEK